MWRQCWQAEPVAVDIARVRSASGQPTIAVGGYVMVYIVGIYDGRRCEAFEFSAFLTAYYFDFDYGC